MFKNFIFSFLIFVISCAGFVQSQTPDWNEETNIYESISNVPLKLINGKEIFLHQLAAEKPLIVALIFTRCTGVCSPLLFQLMENLQNISSGKDNQYSVLVISFDPFDSLKDMRLMAQRIELDNNQQWQFAITDSINRLNASVGFYPVWNDEIKQFDHDALLVGVNSDGYITKKLIGLRNEKEIRLLISSINNVFSPTYRLPNPNNLFSCFNYDPATGKNTPGLGLIFIALPAVISFSLVIGIRFWVKRKSFR